MLPKYIVLTSLSNMGDGRSPNNDSSYQQLLE